MASIRIIFHQSPSIRPSTGKHGELSLATHRAQPHPRQPRYQLQNVWLSPLRNTIVHNSTVLQNTVFYHYVCKAVTLSSHLYKHYVLHTIFFFRARESRELARKRSAPRELQATTELRYPSGRPPPDIALPLWQYPSVRSGDILSILHCHRGSTEPIIAKEPDKTIALRPEPLISPNSNATSSFYSPCRVKI